VIAEFAARSIASFIDQRPEAGAPTRKFQYWSPWLVLFAVSWATVFFSVTTDPLALIEKNWVFVPMGICGAILGNISAVGGGIVFIPCIIFIFQLPAVIALKIALGTQAFGMTSGAVGWLQKRAVPMQALRVSVPGLLIGSSISSFLIHPSAILVKGLFGPVSIVLGALTLILMRLPKSVQSRQDIPDNATVPLFLAAIFGGLITGWVAIGEGEIVAALLMLAYGVDVTAAIGLGVVLLSVNSIYLALVHQFFLGGIPWEYASFTLLGAVFGARFAPWISHHVSAFRLKAIFATIAICDGSIFIYQFMRSH
jgi:uncharacterized membrane protein YfcA